MPERDYLPIAAYGAIGNLRTVALVGRDGSIDWCCLPQLDSASVFGALLDARRGGRFRVAPVGGRAGTQAYAGESNVLHTHWETAAGRLQLTDFLPLRGDLVGRAASEAPPELHRVLRCEGGEAEVEIEWAPRFDYARAGVRIHRAAGGWVAEAEGGAERLTLGGVEDGELRDDGHGPVLTAPLRLRPGAPRALVCRWGTAQAAASPDDSLAWLDETLAAWARWVEHEPVTVSWAGALQPQVTRSMLALKLLIHADTGAIAAAATTSLPEEIGGVRNWDYRFTWIRDASLTAQALTAIGHEREAIDFLHWAERAAAGCEPGWEIQIMYGLRGERELPEQELTHLAGYRGSRPVRIGNGAATQRQLDVYGELLDSAWELARRGARLEAPIWEFLAHAAERATRAADEPDFGIWEVRSEPRHFVYSKAMLWVALDRAVRLAERDGHLQGDVAHWRATRDALHAQVLARGYDAQLGAFTQAYGTRELDASNLLLPIHGVLPADDPRMLGTLDRTLEQLTENGLVYRYRGDDGLPGEEGAFLLCTFWLADALALAGRVDEAWRIFEAAAGCASPLGLLAEQADAHSRELLGNYPQAFSHIGLINSALYLAYAEGRELPLPLPGGEPLHRARG